MRRDYGIPMITHAQNHKTSNGKRSDGKRSASPLLPKQ